MVADTHQYKAKNCTKGIPCGNACISASKKCKSKLPSNVSASLDAIANPANLEKGAESSEPIPLTDKYPPLIAKEYEDFVETKTIGENSVTTSIEHDAGQYSGMSKVSPPPYFQEVTVAVNGTVNKEGEISGKDGLKLALASRETVNGYVKTAPDGTIITAAPHLGDGFGAERTRLYEKAGFSAPDENNVMHSIVRGGKITPITIDEIQALKEAGHFAK
jgi:hypothetical protein